MNSRRSFIRSVLAAVALSPVLCRMGRMGEKIHCKSGDFSRKVIVQNCGAHPLYIVIQCEGVERKRTLEAYCALAFEHPSAVVSVLNRGKMHYISSGFVESFSDLKFSNSSFN